ncbi:MAG: MFS transporter [Gaiellaceae bacterium]
MSQAEDKQAATNRLRAARIAVAYIFFANGAMGGNWATRIPALMDKLGLSVTQVAFALFGAPLGAVLAMPFAGRIVTRFGSRRTARVAFLLYCAAIPPIAFAPNLVVLGLVIFVLGAISAVMDVAMNAHGLVIERRYGRPILSSLHAWFSIGGLFGASTGALAAGVSLGLGLHISIAAGIALAGGFVVGPFLLRGGGDATQERQRFFVKPPKQLVALGLIAFISMLAEGAAADWSTVYIHRPPLGANPGVAALGFVAFSLMMVAGRLSGDRLTMRFGPVALTRGGGLLSAGSLAIALLIGHPIAAIIGFAGMGAGLAIIVPTVFRAAGSRLDVAPGIGLASVSLIGYFGFFVGPPLIGSINHFANLSIALGAVAVIMATIGMLASSAAPAGAPASAPTPEPVAVEE